MSDLWIHGILMIESGPQVKVVIHSIWILLVLAFIFSKISTEWSSPFQ